MLNLLITEIIWVMAQVVICEYIWQSIRSFEQPSLVMAHAFKVT